MKQFIICPRCGMPILATVVEGVVTEFEYHFKCEACECEGFDYDVEIMKAISIRQPWAYLCAVGIKPIENRTWKLPEKYKGERVLIHTGAKPDERHRNMGLLFTQDQWNVLPGDSYNTPNQKYMIHGVWDKSAIIGSVEIVDCVENNPSIWAEKSKVQYLTTERGRDIRITKIYNWVLKNPILFEKPILNVKGKLSFFIPQIP